MKTIEDALNEFVPVPDFVCPAEFWPALGYEGLARYVAIYWEQCGDEAAWADGRVAFVGAHWPAYQALMGHDWRVNHRDTFMLGGSDVAATHWLVFDRHAEPARAWLVPAGEAQDVLRLQWPPEDTAADGIGVVSFEELLSLIESLPAVQPLSDKQVEQHMIESQTRYEALVAALCRGEALEVGRDANDRTSKEPR